MKEGRQKPGQSLSLEEQRDEEEDAAAGKAQGLDVEVPVGS